VLHLPEVPYDLSGGENFLMCFNFLVTFHRELSVDSFGVRPCRNVWMQLFSSSSFTVLSNPMRPGVCNQCQSLQSLLFSSIFCLTNIGQPYALSVSVCFGLACQPAHSIVLLKNLTVTSMSSSVLKETFKDNFSLMRRLKSSQFACLLLKLGCFSWFSACVVSVIKTRK
jgi:hypothetical protein